MTTASHVVLAKSYFDEERLVRPGMGAVRLAVNVVAFLVLLGVGLALLSAVGAVGPIELALLAVLVIAVLVVVNRGRAGAAGRASGTRPWTLALPGGAPARTTSWRPTRPTDAIARAMGYADRDAIRRENRRLRPARTALASVGWTA